MFQKIKQQIPNLFTLGNLACGVIAIYICLTDADMSYRQFQIAGIFILVAGVLDFFDGFIARLLGVSGEMGKQLDSLADMVTFGVAPGFLILSFAMGNQMDYHGWALPFFLLIPLFSAYRLAKFNIDTRQTDKFIGVPTPTNAFLALSFPFIHDTYPEITRAIFTHDIGFLLYCCITSLLLVAEIPLIALKFKGGLKQNLSKIILMGIGLILIIFLRWLAVPIIYIIYILYSVLLNFAENKKTYQV